MSDYLRILHLGRPRCALYNSAQRPLDTSPARHQPMLSECGLQVERRQNGSASASVSRNHTWLLDARSADGRAPKIITARTHTSGTITIGVRNAALA